MIKHRWRELAKSFGNHVDPEKTEQLKRTKSEIENNVTRIFKLIKNEEQGKKEDSRKDSKNESELVGLIENFYQQYQSLYALYDHLVGESGRIVRGKKERKGFALSPSSSDSEYYSSEDVEGNNAKLENEHQKLADSIKHEANTENSGVADLKQKLVSRNEEKEAINSEYMEALRKIRQADNMDKDLKNEMDERVRELSALVEAHEAHGNESSARVKELEGQLTVFKIELESLCCQKRDLEAWKEGKAAEAKQLGEKNIGLHARVFELEIGLKGKEDEISDLQKKLKENEDSSASKVSDLMAQASNLQVEVDSLRAQKGELEQKMVSKKNESLAQVKGLRDQINGVQRELKSLRQQKTESEAQLDKKNKEISKHLLQIENLKEELNRKDTVEMKMMDERQCLLERMKELEMQMDSRRSQKKILEKQIKNRNQETNKLRQENEGLLSKIFELERTLNERGDEFYALRRECEDGKNESSTQFTDLTTQVSNLKQELDSLQTKKSHLQIEKESRQYFERLGEMENQNNKLTGKIARIERENRKYLDRLTEMENQNNNLTVKISEQQRILKEQEDTIRKFNKDHKQAKIWFPSSKLNLQVAERKMEELAEKYRINIEDNVRLLYQRIRVAEQIHNENKEGYKKMKDCYETEIRGLKEKLATYEDPARKMKEISETAKSTFQNGLDLVVLKFEEGHKNFLNQISKMSNDLESAKTWVTGTAGEIKRLKHNVECLVRQLNEKEEQEGVLRDKVCELEASASKEAEEKLNMTKGLSQLEEQVGNLERKLKDKDEDLLILGEEKREAIRHLCVLIDHHRSRYDDLKKVVSKRSAAARSRAVT
ncbi:hypothetical protein PRUPE_5G115200 [Prunus persica]|uniref:NAB domain-containing protein n=1 Tax=Prunus persica TaxID=3760 RepID=A0A251P745_PRUPE|nr:hypothetical protein PRUPE_5G115200 [Prunus persica]ONI07360.1 hypothetical protein PRUPE_5G115200 [Prunus persica]